MFNSKKSRTGMSLSIFVCLFLLAIFASLAAADENYGNLPPDANMWVNPEKFPAIVSMVIIMGDSVIIKIT